MSIDTKIMTQQEFNAYDDKLNAILKDFHGALFKIISIAEQIDPKNYYVTWVKNQIDIFRKIDKENIIKRAKDKFWTYRDEIINRDLAFFYNNQFSAFIKNDDNKPFMYAFVNMLKEKIKTLKQQEMDILWDLLQKVLLAVTEYIQLIGDFTDSAAPTAAQPTPN